MSLLLTRNIDQYGIDIGLELRRGFGAERLRPALLEPLTDEVAVQVITLDHEHALHHRFSP